MNQEKKTMQMNTNHIQAMVDGMGAQAQVERSGSQMTLGGLIERLKELPGKVMVDGFSELDSYRGYYCDLALAPAGETVTVAFALGKCQAAMGEVFEGYKGGDYQMGKNTPVWVAEYGNCGKKIMALSDDGKFTLEDDEA